MSRTLLPGKPYPLGATPRKLGTNFALFSEGATRVDVCLFDENGNQTDCVALRERTAFVWHGLIRDIKPGQLYQGSGTTPTLMGTQYVAIADNADPRMHVDVFLRTASPVANRMVCSEPVFFPGFSDSFNSLIATDTTISVENNYGYDLQQTLFGGTTVPGITRVDLNSGGGGCHTVWENKTLSVPNVVSQSSLATGLEYAYTKQGDLGLTDAWYFTAVDLRTGQLVYKQLAGTGVLFDSHYSGIYLGPDGRTAYVGVLGGLVRIHDRY